MHNLDQKDGDEILVSEFGNSKGRVSLWMKDDNHDIVLSSFTFAYRVVPDDLRQRRYEGNTDLLPLENQLKPLR